MRAIQRLLLLAEFVLLARCQQKPQVDISPQLPKIFLGDSFLVRCGNSNVSKVTWYVNDAQQVQRTQHTWKIEAAALQHSGRYQCERDGVKSDDYLVTVHGYAPEARLFIRTGQPVVRREGSVLLQLDREDGVKGWKCWVDKGEQTEQVSMRGSGEKDVSVVFQTYRLTVPESVFWCTGPQPLRSNQIRVRTSATEQSVALEMYPMPAVVGESLTLNCLAWGAQKIIRAVFYKNDQKIQDTQNSTFQINNVSESTGGRYKCEITYAYIQRPAGPPYHVVSDAQQLVVQVSPMRAVVDVSAGSSMSCSCRLCPADGTYRWYKMVNGEARTLPGSSQRVMTPKESGTYACRVVWAEGRSLLSTGHSYQSEPTPIVPIISVILVVLGLVCVCFGYMRCKKRNTTEQVYEDVPMRPRDAGDGGYDALQKGTRDAADYEDLAAGASGDQAKGGEYEALKKQDGAEYDTLQAGASGDQAKGGEYEALKKQDGAEYDTLQAGASGDQAKRGEYEALKKQDVAEYDTLQAGASGDQAKGGEYEALKKQDGAEGVYHTLGMPGAAGGESA